MLQPKSPKLLRGICWGSYILKTLRAGDGAESEQFYVTNAVNAQSFFPDVFGASNSKLILLLTEKELMESFNCSTC